MSDKLLLLDAMALIYRAHFAFLTNPVMNSAGLNTSAVFGYVNTLLQLLEREAPTHVALAMDTPGPTERHRLYPAYKAQRDEVPEDIITAVPYVERITQAMGIRVIRLPGYEADDIIGTLADRASAEGMDVWMVTPDKDFAQLVSDSARILKPGRKGNEIEIVDLAKVREKWQVETSEQVADILGLWGDASDNIPGVPGIGEKTGKKLIAEYGSVENLIDHASELKGKLKERVLEHADQARLSKTLATINRNSPVVESPEDLRLGERDEKTLSELLVELEFNTLGKRILGDGFSSGRGHVEPDQLPGQQEMDLDGAMLDRYDTKRQKYELVTDLDALRTWVKACLQTRLFCLDTETDGLNTHACRLLGISLSHAENAAMYSPVPSAERERTEWMAVFQELFSSSAAKVGHNLKFDILVLRQAGFEIHGPFHDSMIAHFLVDPDGRHGMDDLAQRYLGYEPIPITSLIGHKKADQTTLFDAPLEEVAIYASEDADITLRLHKRFVPKLKKEAQDGIYRDIEMPLLDVLATMEQEGIRVDPAVLSEISGELQQQIHDMEQQAHTLAGHAFNVNSPRQLGEVLFDELKISEKPKKTRTGQYATNEQILQTLVGSHELVDLILEYREAAKLKSTYVDALPREIQFSTGRIHTSFSQIGAATGRLSSSNPNLQNIPIRTETGRRIRAAFVPHGPGDVLMSADYSQIELRVMAELSRDPGMVEAFELGLDIHTATAARVYGVELDSVESEMRRKAKMVNFGIIYGISAFGLSQRLRIPRGEAAEIIESYFTQYPGVKKFMEQTVKSAQTLGYVETLSGRRRLIRDINSRNHMIRSGAERVAINAPVQGTAADMIKLAMIRIHHRLLAEDRKARMLLQVHDELVLNVPGDEIDAVRGLVEEEMKSALPLHVPILVETGTGQNWLEAH